MELETWFERLWTNYAALAPKVATIRNLLEERGEFIVDDHVAFRTFNIAPIGLDQLAPVIESLGYTPFDDYHFETKKLRARSYIHPDEWPRVFLSELLVEKLEPAHQEAIRALTDQIPADYEPTAETFLTGTLWDAVPYETYQNLQSATEYGAWLAALGLRPNHFTVNVNSLDSFTGLEPLLDFIEKKGFPLNEAGGRVKGTPEVLLEQGSTLADQIQVEFADGLQTIPTCYYEFALRHPTATGMYEGFVAESADRIFESTHSTDT